MMLEFNGIIYLFNPYKVNSKRRRKKGKGLS